MYPRPRRAAGRFAAAALVAALAALSLGYAGGLLQCGVCGAGPISTPMPPYDS